MGRDLTPQCKLCRREGMKLYLKGARCHTPKCAIVRRNYPPGIHGQKQVRGRRQSGYGQQLREKQKAKRLYHIFEKQFRNYFDSATNKVGDTGQNFLQLLEMRLDNVIYKAGFADSLRKARQIVGHGHLLVNGKRVDIPSYQVRINDVISLRERSSKSKLFADLAERMKTAAVPDWLFYDSKETSVKIVGHPELEKATLSFDMKQIIEFYSR